MNTETIGQTVVLCVGVLCNTVFIVAAICWAKRTEDKDKGEDWQ